MINLLPKENVKLLKISFYNNLLLKLLFISIITLLTISGIFGLEFLELSNQDKLFKSQLELSSSKFARLNGLEKRSNQLKNDIQKMNVIFTDQKHYTVFLTELAKSLPKNVEINQISISPDMVQSPASVIIHTTDYETILKAKHDLEKSSLIKSVDIRSVTNKEKAVTKDTLMLLEFDQNGVNEVLKW